MRATARRWRGARVGVRFGCGGFGRRAGGLRQQEKVFQVAQRLAARGMPQAVIADLVEAGRQDVLEEAPDKFLVDVLPAVSRTTVLPVSRAFGCIL
jgi:hypothetical protein